MIYLGIWGKKDNGEGNPFYTLLAVDSDGNGRIFGRKRGSGALVSWSRSGGGRDFEISVTSQEDVTGAPRAARLAAPGEGRGGQQGRVAKT